MWRKIVLDLGLMAADLVSILYTCGDKLLSAQKRTFVSLCSENNRFTTGRNLLQPRSRSLLLWRRKELVLHVMSPSRFVSIYWCSKEFRSDTKMHPFQSVKFWHKYDYNEQPTYETGRDAARNQASESLYLQRLTSLMWSLINITLKPQQEEAKTKMIPRLTRRSQGSA